MSVHQHNDLFIYLQKGLHKVDPQNWFTHHFDFWRTLQKSLCHYIRFCIIHTIVCQSLKTFSAQSLSLLSLSEYAPSRLRDDEPFCLVMDFEAFVVTAVFDAFESVKQETILTCHPNHMKTFN